MIPRWRVWVALGVTAIVQFAFGVAVGERHCLVSSVSSTAIYGDFPPVKLETNDTLATTWSIDLGMPVKCTVGKDVYRNAQGNIWICAATNTWTAATGGGSGETRNTQQITWLLVFAIFGGAILLGAAYYWWELRNGR